MPIDVSADFTSHSEKHKVGVITSAEIRAGAIHVAGHLFSENFPTEVAEIRANKDAMGMSFEARQISCVDTSATVLVISDLQFVGACILKRSAAAFFANITRSK